MGVMSDRDEMNRDRSQEKIDKLEATIRVLTEQIVERDAVIEQANDSCADCDGYGWVRIAIDDAVPCENPMHQVFLRAPHDALAARDAVRDKTVRATALREAATWYRREGFFSNTRDQVADTLEGRADQEEDK